MTDTPEPASVVTRTNKDAARKGKARPERSSASKGAHAAMWTAVMIMGAITLIPITGYAQQEIQTWSLLQADEAGINRALAEDWKHSGSASYVEAISELSLDLPKPDLDVAKTAAERATSLDASRAHAWAAQAWFEYTKAGSVNPAVLDMLTKSMDACPFCDEALLRWRFNFVLANWAAIPEPLRVRAFEQADLLRWSGDNQLFLAEMGAKARQAGIPFDTYRAAVKTPVRTVDLVPAPAPIALPAAAPTPPGG